MSGLIRLITILILFQKSNLKNTPSFKWLGSILKETTPEFYPLTNNSECAKDVALYVDHLKNGTSWAVSMLDSTATTPAGIMNGNLYNFGNFDQCISINVMDLNIYGKYCLVKMRYWPTSELYPSFYDNNITVYQQPPPISPVWSMLRVTGDPRFQRRDIIYVGMCMPHSCSHNDLRYSLENAYIDSFLNKSINVDFTTSKNFCVSESEKYMLMTPGFFVYIGIFIVLLAAVTLSTGMHVYNEAMDVLKDEWYYSLSALYNIRQMKKPVAKEYAPACGLKVLSMFIVIYGHRHLLSLYAPTINLYQNEKRFGQFWETYILNGSIVVDTFFCASGFITYHKMLSGAEKKNSLTLLFYLVYRWIRISVIFMTAVFFMAYVLPFTGSGPLWKNECLERSKVCLKYWWVHLTYIGNYLYADKLCLIPAWYLACDMQLFLLSLLLIYVNKKSKFWGKVVLLTLICLAVILPGIVVFFKQYYGTFRFYLRHLSNFYSNEEYLNIYSSTVSRSSPYLIGMGSAYKLMKMKKNSITIPFWLHVLLAFSTIFITAISILSAWPFYLPGHKYSPIENALYAALSKVLWATNMCWIIMANSVGGENLLSSKILSSKMFAVLHKLTLCVLLVHTPLQFILIFSIRTPQYLTHFTTVWMALGDIFLSYIISFVVYLLLEAPIAGFFIRILKK